MDGDYSACIRAIDPRDSYLMDAARFGSGIRILRQDLWEMIVSFIVSQQNNIRRIKKILELLSQRYGTKMTDLQGKEYYAFRNRKNWLRRMKKHFGHVILDTEADI